MVRQPIWAKAIWATALTSALTLGVEVVEPIVTQSALAQATSDRNTNDRKAEAGHFVELGRAAERSLRNVQPEAAQEYYQQAIDAWEQAIAIYRSLNDLAKVAEMQFAIGELQAESGKFAAANTSFRAALVLTDNVDERFRRLSSIAQIYADLDQRDQTLSHLQDELAALQTAKAASDPEVDLATLQRHEARLQQLLGETYANLEQLEQAQQHLQQGFTLLRSVSQFSPSQEKSAYERLAQDLAERQESAPALYFFQQALAIQQDLNQEPKTRSITVEIDLLTTIGGLQIRLEQAKAGRESLQQALTLQRSLIANSANPTNRRGEAELLGRIGFTLLVVGDYEGSVEYYLAALELQRSLNLSTGLSSNLLNLGGAYFNLGEIEQGIRYSEQALDLIRNQSDKREEAQATNNLGVFYWRLGEYQTAIEYYQQTLAIAQAQNNWSAEIPIYNNLGIIYLNLGEYEQAIDYMHKSLAVRDEQEAYLALNDHVNGALALSNLGRTYFTLAQYEQAIPVLQEATVIQQEFSDRRGLATSINNLGNVYLKLGNFDQAIAMQQQSLETAQAIGNTDVEARALHSLGEIKRDRNEPQKAVNYFQQALAIRQVLGDREGAAISLTQIGHVFEDLADPELAITFYKEAVNVRESIRQGIKGLSTDLQQSYTDAVIAADYRHLADLLLAQGRILEAQQILELLKIQELRDYTQDTRAGGETDGSGLSVPEQAVSDTHSDLIAIGLELTACEQQQPYCAERAELQAQRKAANAAFTQSADTLRSQARSQRADDPGLLDPN
ncbi:MAG: tetratricopeptide repeat protein, partial [Cyanobacteria bacterium P01_H01_bin.121]